VNYSTSGRQEDTVSSGFEYQWITMLLNQASVWIGGPLLPKAQVVLLLGQRLLGFSANVISQKAWSVYLFEH
jgi:hypothetical protein